MVVSVLDIKNLSSVKVHMCMITFFQYGVNSRIESVHHVSVRHRSFTTYINNKNLLHQKILSSSNTLYPSAGLMEDTIIRIQTHARRNVSVFVPCAADRGGEPKLRCTSRLSAHSCVPFIYGQHNTIDSTSDCYTPTHETKYYPKYHDCIVGDNSSCSIHAYPSKDHKRSDRQTHDALH